MTGPFTSRTMKFRNGKLLNIILGKVSIEMGPNYVFC